jgi:phospholipid/cholesterol/gamma-HCH transport system permease protein
VNLAQVKETLNSFLIFMGNIGRNFAGISYSIAWGKFSVADFFKDSVALCYGVMMPVFIIAIALGVVIGVQLGPQFVSKGLGSDLGILSALMMTRELVPVVGSLMIATQYGTGLTAELANMKITEQIEALKVFRVNPIEYLVVPKFLAAVIFTPVIIWLASLIAIASSYITVYLTEGLRFKGFMRSIWTYYKISDISLCLTKSAVFGGMIVLIAITLGLEVEGGAKEVGKATTLTVILSFIMIVLVDYVITTIYL